MLFKIPFVYLTRLVDNLKIKIAAQINWRHSLKCHILFYAEFLAPISGGQNLWLEPQIFEFGKPMSLNCNITERTKAIAWWIVEEDRSPKKISNELVLNFASASHRHSAIYECFHSFENNRFLKYSREALVVGKIIAFF